MPEIKNILCLVAARGNSKGVPGKNIRPLLGETLISRAVKTALGAPEIHEVIISTDSQEMSDAAVQAGAIAPFLRPDFLASDGAGKFQVWQHALEFCEEWKNCKYDLFIDIDCTNPMIDSRDVSNSINLFNEEYARNPETDAVFTVATARRNPYFNLVEPDKTGGLKFSKTQKEKILARQKAPPVFEHVAGVYVLKRDYLKSADHLLDGHAIGYEVPEEKSFDIDTEFDWNVMEFLLKRAIA